MTAGAVAFVALDFAVLCDSSLPLLLVPRKFEGRGWAKMDKVTKANTFTDTTSKK